MSTSQQVRPVAGLRGGSWWRAAWAVATLALATGAAAAPGSVVRCPDYVRQVTDDPLGYQPRPGRCEGRYDYKGYSANSTLWVAGFTEHFGDFPLDGRRALLVDWYLEVDEQVALEAVALAPRTFYRMDASPSASTRSFTWPLNILAGLGLGASEVGVTAHVSRSIDGRKRRVLLPLRLDLVRGHATSPPFTLLLGGSGEIRRAYVSVTPGSKAGGATHRKTLDSVHSHGAYSVEIPIDRPASAGIYLLEVAVELADGSYDSLPRIWFLNPGPRYDR